MPSKLVFQGVKFEIAALFLYSYLFLDNGISIETRLR